MKNYYIKDGYQPFPTQLNLTHNQAREDNYWSSERIESSRVYQWHVYQYLYKSRKGAEKVVDVGC